MLDLPLGNVYRIKNKASGRYLTQAGFESGSSKTIQTGFIASGERGYGSQLWHIFPLGHGEHFVVNKHSGLTVGPWDYSSSFNHMSALHIASNVNDIEAQVWFIEGTLVEDGRKVEDCTFINKRNQGRMVVEKHLYGDEWVGAYRRAENPEDALWHTWELESVEQIKRAVELPERTKGLNDNGFGEIIRLDSRKMPRRDTDEKLVGETFIPCVLVNDSRFGSDHSEKIEKSPYYFVEKCSYWHLGAFTERSGRGPEETVTERVAFGLTSENSREIEESIKVSVGAEAEFGFKGVGAKISSSFSRDLNTKRTDKEIVEHKREATVEVKFSKGDDVAVIANWYRQDHYILRRTDGSIVSEWTVGTKTRVEDCYPQASRGKY